MPLISQPIILTANLSQLENGDVLSRAADRLAGAGIRIDRSGNRLAFKTPPMHSNRDNPLFYLGQGTISVAGRGTVELTADLTGARRLQKFILVFPAVLGLFLAGGFLTLGMPKGALIGLLSVAPWVVIAPLMSKKFQRCAVEAAETFLHNLGQS